MSTINLDNETILVTGAAGFIGSNLVKRIYQEAPSATVIGIDNMNAYYDVALKEFRLNELAKYPTFTFAQVVHWKSDPLAYLLPGRLPESASWQCMIRFLFEIPLDSLVEPALIGVSCEPSSPQWLGLLSLFQECDRPDIHRSHRFH